MTKSLKLQNANIESKINTLTNQTFVGIDFGTSTTVVSLAYYDTCSRRMRTTTLTLNQKLADGAIYQSDKIPSMIAWHNKQILVGEGANQVKLKKIKNKNIWYAFKMDLGKKEDYLYPQSELSQTAMKLHNGKDGVTIFFKYLYQQINKFINDNNYPSNIAYSISIPASFEPNQRKDMIDALTFNNFNFSEQAFIDEPNAAFLSYMSDPILQQNVFLSEEYPSNILVFDYGAGTCDISILEVSLDLQTNKFNSANIAISKFAFIGGKEIDKLIAVDVLLPQLLNENNLDAYFFSTREIKNYILPKLERYAELLKIEASKSIALAIENIHIESYTIVPVT